MENSMLTGGSGGSGAAHTAASVSSMFQLSVNSIAVIIGLAAVIVAIGLVRKLGGRINLAIRYFILGIVCNATAIGWSIFFDHIYVIGGSAIDVHQNLMTLGMIFFIVSTFKFYKIIRNV